MCLVMASVQLTTNVVGLTPAIGVCKEAKQWRWGLTLFQQMPLAEVLPDSYTYTSIMSAYGQGLQWPEAIRLFQNTISEQNVYSFAAAINILREDQKWELALSLFGAMDDLQIQPDTEVFNGAIRACKASSEWDACQ